MPDLNLTRDEAAERSALLDVSSYDIVLELDPASEVFRSTTTVKFEAAQGAGTFIDALTRKIHRIELNGTSLDPAEVATDFRIRLPLLADENELVVDADFAYTNTGEGLHKFTDPADGEVYLYSQFEVADSRRVFAVFEQPDLKATFSFSVLAPEHWRVVSNSPTPSPEPATPLETASGAVPRLAWRFAPTPPISSYITAIIAGPYESVHSSLTSSDGRTIPLGVYARTSLAQHLDAENVFDVTRRGFEFYEKNFGVPYPFEKYDQLFVPEFNAGAMENAGAVTFVEQYIFRSQVPEATVERRAVTILHELAHMWFGDLVTMTWWNDLWLNESFAEYMSTLATAEATEWTQAWTTFAAQEKSWAYRQDQLPSTHPIVADIRDLEDVEVNFDGITYAKGASVLKQLVAWVGQEEFLAGVRSYFAKHAWSNTELTDLLDELEATSGRDLRDWSRLWLEESGITSLRPEITTSADGLITAFDIVQEAPVSADGRQPSLRPHRLAVGFYDLDDAAAAGPVLRRTARFELDVAGARTSVQESIGARRPTLVLVNDDDLAYAKVRLDEPSLEAAREHLSLFEESLPRTLVWGAAWDMVRDGETSARGYLPLVLDNIAAESDSSVVLVLLRQLATALDFYTAPGHRGEAGAMVGDRLLELTRAADGGTDRQLQFVKAAIRHASTGDQLDFVEGLYRGTQDLPGLEVDTDLRWELLAALVAAGRTGEAGIAAELGRDNTATGHRAAALARAAVPTAEAKRAAWESMVGGGDMTNAVLGSTIAGFTRVREDSLLEPYVEKYFEIVREVWEGRSHEISQQILVGLYPHRLVGDGVIARTRAWLAANEDSPAGCRRLMIENLDTMERALRAQRRDAE